MHHAGDAAQISFSDRPPPPPGFVPVLRPGDGEILRLVALGDRIEGTFVHFVAGRSSPCVGPGFNCRVCRGQKKRWIGYLMAYLEARRQVVLAELTASAVRDCRDLTLGTVLRGRRFEVERVGEGRQGRVQLRLGRMVARADDLPDAPDTREALCRMWGVPLDEPGDDVTDEDGRAIVDQAYMDCTRDERGDVP